MTITNNKCEMACHVYGHAETTLLFVHGSNIDQSYFESQVNFFKPSYRVVTFDLPGQGHSGNNRDTWSLEDYASDVNAVIEKLQLHRVILIGHSMGAYVNLIAAAMNRKPILGFIGIDIMKNVGVALPENVKEATMEGLRTDYKKTNEMFVRDSLTSSQTPPEIVDRVIADYRNSYQPMGMQIMPQILNFSELDKKWLPKLKLKLYLINVRYMPTRTSLMESYVGAEYELSEIGGTSHFPMLENPRELNFSLASAIRRIEESQFSHSSSRDQEYPGKYF